MKPRKIIWLFVVLFMLSVRLAWSSAGERLFVIDGSEGSIHVVDINTLKETAVIPLKEAGAMAMTAYGDKLYCVDALLIHLLNQSTLANLATLNYDGFSTPGLIKARTAQQGKKLYVGVIGWGKEADSGIFVIDTDKKEQVKVIAKNNIKTGYLDVSQDQSYIYFSDLNGIGVLCTQDDKVVETITLQPGEWAWDIASGEGDELFASVYTPRYPKGPGTYGVLAVNVRDKTQKRLAMNEKIIRIFYSPRSKILFALNWSKLYRIDAETLSIINSFPLSGVSLTMTPDESKLFIASRTGEIFNVDPNTGNILSSIKVTEKPYELFIY